MPQPWQGRRIRGFSPGIYLTYDRLLIPLRFADGTPTLFRVFIKLNVVKRSIRACLTNPKRSLRSSTNSLLFWIFLADRCEGAREKGAMRVQIVSMCTVTSVAIHTCQKFHCESFRTSSNRGMIALIYVLVNIYFINYKLYISSI